MPDLAELKERFVEAVIKRIEGSKDIRKKLDYLMKPDYIETSSVLTFEQIDALTAMIQIGTMFNTLSPLKDYARLFASWTPSKDGSAREQLVKVMMQVAPEQPPNVTHINTGAPQIQSGLGNKNED